MQHDEEKEKGQSNVKKERAEVWDDLGKFPKTRAYVDWSAMSWTLCLLPSVIGSQLKFSMDDLIDRLKSSLCMLGKRWTDF